MKIEIIEKFVKYTEYEINEKWLDEKNIQEIKNLIKNNKELNFIKNICSENGDSNITENLEGYTIKIK